MTPQEEALLRIAIALFGRLRRLARKVDRISGTDVTNLRDSISIGGGTGGGSDTGFVPGESDPVLIVRIVGGAAAYAVGGMYVGHIMEYNGTPLDPSPSVPLDITDYFDVGEEVVVVNTF